ncbi:hypothetical protein Mapa_007201 [Marchantia paleacea]|nr:hypothetical protein Mapa_007201 [Marchantia paleacea]
MIPTASSSSRQAGRSHSPTNHKSTTRRSATFGISTHESLTILVSIDCFLSHPVASLAGMDSRTLPTRDLLRLSMRSP